MNHKFSEIIHSFFAIVAFLGIIGLSSFVAMNLNPISIREKDQFIGPEIAGVSIGQQPLNFINRANESQNYRTNLESSPDNLIYIAKFSKQSNTMEDNFLKVQNTGDSNGAFSIEAQIPQEIVKDMKIQIQDADDTIHLNNLEQRIVTVNKKSERNFKIVYTFNRPINYEFEIRFKIVN